MKSFKEYLTESKKTYDFKVKIAGECPENCVAKIKEALSMYDVASCSEGARTPIQETHYDFPDHKNIEVTTFDVCLNYPTNSPAVRQAIAEKLNLTNTCVLARTPGEEAEIVLNHANDKSTDKSVLEDDTLEEVDGQKLVGDKHIASFLKELSKTKTSGTQVKGTNDKILAKKSPSEKTVKADKVSAAKSPLSAASNPDLRKGK